MNIKQLTKDPPCEARRELLQYLRTEQTGLGRADTTPGF